MTSPISESDWDRFARDGYLHLGQLLSAEEVDALKQRADDIALGRVAYDDEIRLQLDTGGAYEDLPTEVERFETGTLRYRKIQGLETDDLFRRLVTHPRSLEVCARLYGAHASISIFRAMIMNKPAGQGTVLPWHQDGGEVWKLDRDPLVTIWVALDPATQANGCMECVPGSHLLGLLSQDGSTISDAHAAEHCPPDARVPLEVEPGHGVLLHNWLIHRSGVNTSDVPRRGFTACYMDARTRNTLTGGTFPLVHGAPAPDHAWAAHLMAEREHYRAAAAGAEEYALSLRDAMAETERYAKSLEEERERLQAASAAP